MLLPSLPFYLGTPFQGITAALIAAIGALGIWYIRGWPERRRADNESVALKARLEIEAEEHKAKIEKEARDEAATKFREFRLEVHGLRNEVAALQGELRAATNKSMRRGDKMDMLRFILGMVLDELHAKDSSNKVLAQARLLLTRVEDEPHDPANSETLNRAEDTVVAAKATVREVMANEALNSSESAP